MSRLLSIPILTYLCVNVFLEIMMFANFMLRLPHTWYSFEKMLDKKAAQI